MPACPSKTACHDDQARCKAVSVAHQHPADKHIIITTIIMVIIITIVEEYGACFLCREVCMFNSKARLRRQGNSLTSLLLHAIALHERSKTTITIIQCEAQVRIKTGDYNLDRPADRQQKCTIIPSDEPRACAPACSWTYTTCSLVHPSNQVPPCNQHNSALCATSWLWGHIGLKPTGICDSASWEMSCEDLQHHLFDACSSCCSCACCACKAWLALAMEVWSRLISADSNARLPVHTAVISHIRSY